MTGSNPWLFVTRPISGVLLAAPVLSTRRVGQHRRCRKTAASADGDADF